MAEVTQQQVVEYIKGISVLELSQLVKTLESELGVSAAAAMPMAMPMGGGGGGAAAPAEEKTEFTVTLTEVGGNKINVIKVVREDHQPGSQGSQGPRRGRAQADQGRRPEGRGRGDQEEVRRGRREGRSQVARRFARLADSGWGLGAARPGLLACTSAEPRVLRLRAPVRALRFLFEVSRHVQPSQERLPRAHRLFENQDDRSDPEPDRDPEEVLRALPADEPSAERARGRGSPVGVQVGLPDQRLPRELVARVHRVFDRQLGVQVRQAARAAPPAQAVQQLRRDADRRSVRRPRSALPALRQGATRRAATSATSAATPSA